jgi:hypothetical protein
MLTVLVADDKRQYCNKEEDVSLRNTVISSQVPAVDDVDFVPNNAHVTNFDILVLTVSIISHIIDIGLDINLAYRYFHSGRSEYFILTVIFILFPAFVNTVISVRM